MSQATLNRRERRARAQRRRRSGLAAASLAAVLVLGGLGAAGALPGTAGNGDAQSRVDGARDRQDSAHSDTEAESDGPSASSDGEGTGLANAAGNVTNPVASAVLETLLSPSVAGLQGSGRGEAVSDAATTAAQAQGAAPTVTGADHRP